METKLIAGVTPAPHDDKIAALIDHENENPWGGGPTRYRIAVLNVAGELARSIGAEDLGTYVRTCEGIKALRFVDELAEVAKGRDGWDSIMRPIP